MTTHIIGATFKTFRLATFSLLFIAAGYCNAQNYFVNATSGNDSNPGTSADLAWKTLSKVNQTLFEPGDEILFNCGGVWREKLNATSSGTINAPITYGRYGSNCSRSNKPLILGSESVDNWSVSSIHPNIYVAPVALYEQAENFVKNGTMDVNDAQWRQWSDPAVNPGADVLDWQADCNGKTGCLRFTPVESGSLATSTRFALETNKQYRLTIQLRPSIDNLPIQVIIRRDEPSWDILGHQQWVTLNADQWTTYSITFTATETTDKVRLDLYAANSPSILSEQYWFIDNVSIVPIEPVQALVNDVYVNNQYMRLAQFPNPRSTQDVTDTYLSIAADGGSDTNGNGSCNPQDAGNTAFEVDPNDLAGLTETDLIGAGIHIRSARWDIDDRIVTQYDGLMLSYDRATSHRTCKGWGYYLDNKLSMLDQSGEWFYDQSAQLLYLWSNDGNPPQNVEVSYRHGIDLKEHAYIHVDNIHLARTNTAISFAFAPGIAVSNCEIEDSSLYAIDAKGSADSSIRDCSIQRTVRSAIIATSSSNIDIRNNKITDTGTIGSPKDSEAAISQWGGKQGIISNNNLEQCGYACITVGGDNTQVSKNVIKDSCLVIDDCAGIYTSGHNAEAKNGTSYLSNIVINSLGNSNGLPGTSTAAQGLYLDDFSNDMIVEDNVVINADFGIQVHNAFNNVISNNLYYASRKYSMYISEDTLTTNGTVHSNNISEEIHFPLNMDSTLRLAGSYSNIDFGVFTRGRYSGMYTPYPIHETYYPTGTSSDKRYKLDDWFAVRQQGLEATLFNAVTLASSKIDSISGDNLVSNSTFDVDTTGWSRWNTNILPPDAACIDAGCLVFERVIADRITGGNVNHSRFSINQGQTYVLHFDMQANRANQQVTIGVLGNGAAGENGEAGYANLGMSKTLTIDSNWQSYYFIFTANQSRIYDSLIPGSGARINIHVPELGDITRVDNIYLEPVSVTHNDTSDDAVIIVNESNSSRRFRCPNEQIPDRAKCDEFIDFMEEEQVEWPLRLRGKAAKILVWANNPFNDADGDGVVDASDQCMNTPGQIPVNIDGCSFYQMHGQN